MSQTHSVCVGVCVSQWSPLDAGHVWILEAVQRSFTANIAGLKNLNCWERLVGPGPVLFGKEKRAVLHHRHVENN